MSSRTLQLDDRTHAYLLAKGVREHPVAAALREATAARDDARMQISPEQGAFLTWLVRALGVQRALEVGTFTGYSALALALGMPEDGHLLCCDVNAETTALGREHWDRAGVGDRIELVIAPASETLSQRIVAGEGGSYDLVFLDADKTGYAAYVEAAHALLRPGGVVLIDNVLWSGSVADPDDTRESTVALRQLNAALHDDDRWDLSMLPVGDGLTLLRKR